LIDLCGLKHRRVEAALDAALSRGLVSLGEVWLLLERDWMRGRRGVAIMRSYLIPRTGGQAPSDSELELQMRRLVDTYGLPAPQHQYAVALSDVTVHIDLAWPFQRLAIELDSYTWHGDRISFERDRQRDNQLRARGWTVLRFTWAMLRYEPDDVIGLVRDCLDRPQSA
jgi:hypothetical protein